MIDSPDPSRDQRWAWAFVVFIVAGAILGQLVGYGIASMMGYAGADAPTPPFGAALLIGVPALLISSAPGAAAAYFGIRAGLAGKVMGYVAATLGVLSIAFWVVITTSAVLSTR
jgi:hypothetical protein